MYIYFEDILSVNRKRFYQKGRLYYEPKCELYLHWSDLSDKNQAHTQKKRGHTCHTTETHIHTTDTDTDMHMDTHQVKYHYEYGYAPSEISL